MIMRSVWIIFGLTVVAASTAFAEDNRQQIDQIIAAYHENWNNHNAAGIASLYTKDAILVTRSPTQMVKNGTQEIEQNYQKLFAVVPHHDSATADQIIPLGTNVVMSVGQYHLTGQGQSGPTKIDGHWTAVYVPEGSKLKIRLLTAVDDQPKAE
jgi:uncharacterized protein (TIGR02246 family)